MSNKHFIDNLLVNGSNNRTCNGHKNQMKILNSIKIYNINTSIDENIV